MKREIFAFIMAALLGLPAIYAAEAEEAALPVLTIKSPRFARPLVERWIAEYTKSQPRLRLELAQGQQSASLHIVLEGDGHQNPAVFFGQYAVLPVAASGSEAASLLSGKHLSVQRLKELYFVDDELDEPKAHKQYEHITVYSGSSQGSVARQFARHLGLESADFRGRRISGDDLFLNTALQKDPTGISVNALPNIYDLKSRHLRQGLSLIALDDGELDANATLDEVLNRLEQDVPEEVATGRIGLSFDTRDEALNHFLQWVLDHAQLWNHEYGLLNLDVRLSEAEHTKLNHLLTARK
ncbi:MAG: hypothetical protein IJ544_07020 [Prevotella sp.]|nr:hypothetical protein [Prevotella sp.]